MPNDNTIDLLNHLLAINKDAETGFRSAAGTIRNSELDTLFTGYADQHAKFAAELDDEIARLHGDVAHSGTFGGAVHRGWMDLKSALTGHSAASILASCEDGELSAEVAYDDADKANPTGQTSKLIDKHRQQIKAFRTHLTRLVSETKDGVDFQKNE